VAIPFVSLCIQPTLAIGWLTDDGTPYQNQYASEVQQLLSEAGIYADVDNGSETFKKKIRNGEVAQYNFLLGKSLHLCPING
jgi:Anticodon binding domain